LYLQSLVYKLSTLLIQKLKVLPIDYLKIDKEFTFNILKNPKDKALTKTIIDLAKNLELEIIVEWVETKEHVEFFVQNNCKYAQGYFYSKAIPVQDLEAKI